MANDGTDGRTDRRTDDRYIEPAQHTMRPVSTIIMFPSYTLSGIGLNRLSNACRFCPWPKNDTWDVCTGTDPSANNWRRKLPQCSVQSSGTHCPLSRVADYGSFCQTLKNVLVFLHLRTYFLFCSWQMHSLLLLLLLLLLNCKSCDNWKQFKIDHASANAGMRSIALSRLS